MAGWDELSEDSYDQMQEADQHGVLEELVNKEIHELGSKAFREVADQLGFQKIKTWIIRLTLCFMVLLLVILLLYGAAIYLGAVGASVWDNITHYAAGSRTDNYVASYYNEAKAIKEAILDGSISIGNDMAMLSKEDLIMILDYVDVYNQKFEYITSPERIRYEYKEVSRVNDGLQMSELEALIFPWEKQKTVYGMETVSYASFGKHYYNSLTGEQSFAVPWQTVVVLCEMLAENNYEKFGSDEDFWNTQYYGDFISDYSFQTPMDGYFITDLQVEAVCSLISYQINTYKVSGGKDYVELTQELIENHQVHYGGPDSNGGKNSEGNPYNMPNSDTYGLSYTLDDMKKITYRKEEYDADPKEEGEGSTGRTESEEPVRIPALAPSTISNIYTMITYHYTRAEEGSDYGASYCDYMTVTIDARRFMDYVQAMIPDFSFSHFMELLKLLPNSNEEVEKYESIWKLYQRGQEAERAYNLALETGTETGITAQEVQDAYQISTTYYSDFVGYMVYIGSGAYIRQDAGTDFVGASSIWVGMHLDANGRPAVTPRGDVPAEYNGWLPIEEGAGVSMMHTDGLTREQVKAVLETVGGWCTDMHVGGLFKREDTADALYDWQEKNDASITAILAIAKIEGTLNFGNASLKKWNFFNYGTADYKEAYQKKFSEEAEAFIEALKYQMDCINTYYLQAGQDTYFKMQWGSGFQSAVASQEFYQEAEKYIVHSYCPWWDDCSFPFGEEGNRLSGIGWCNNCAESRERLLNAAGLTVSSVFCWPVPEYSRVSSEFGARTEPVQGASKYHNGMDIAASKGAEILAVSDGIVINDPTIFSETGGYIVEIAHADGITKSRYLHMEVVPMVRKGDSVEKGQRIAEVGNAGISTGYHLHLEIHENGIAVDPRNYLTEPQKNGFAVPLP